MRLLIIKFGGTSVGSAGAMQQAASIVHQQTLLWDHIVVVVSAMTGTTNALLSSVMAASSGEESEFHTKIDGIHQRHLETINTLFPNDQSTGGLIGRINQIIQDLYVFCQSIHVLGEVTPRGTDLIAAMGEKLCMHIFSHLLDTLNVASAPIDSTRLIVTDDHFMNALPLLPATQEKVKITLQPLLNKGLTPVVTGFIGATESGAITTLGRGGSDFTAAILAACLDTTEVWTFTDVDGVMTADPRIVPHAQVIPQLSYKEIGEMAYFGAKVLHPRTIQPIIERGIPLWVKNTFNPDKPGTLISNDAENQPGKITAIAAIQDISLVNVVGLGMVGVPGIAARTFSAVAREGASVLMISQSSSEQSICFAIPTKHAVIVKRSIEAEMSLELLRRDIDRITLLEDVVILTVIGANLRDKPGLSAKIFGALGKANINVIAIAQGSSELSVSLVVTSIESTQAVRAIHAEVIENNF